MTAATNAAGPVTAPAAQAEDWPSPARAWYALTIFALTLAILIWGIVQTVRDRRSLIIA